MEVLQYLSDGFKIVLTGTNLSYCFIGVLWGTIVGILPGLGPLAGTALLLPLTFKMDPTSGMIMLAGVFYGSMYGGSTTSILMNMPGEVASIMTTLDGYQMARKGRAGPALVIAALGSFVGGSVSIVALMLFAPPLAQIMLKIGPGEEFSLMVLALLIMSYVSSTSILKTISMAALGMLIACIGMDPFTGYLRFGFGFHELAEGIGIVPIAIGLFGLSEIMINAENIVSVEVIKPTFKSLLPRLKDLKDSVGAVARGSVIGMIFGFVPGISHVTSTFVSYAVEKKIAKNPEEFGTGRIEGVAGPESANNATTGTSLVPLFVLGIPSIPATALYLSALMVHGINPGPQMIQDHPGVFWGLIASMYIGNIVLVILNIPMVGIFVNFLRIPYRYLVPTIMVISVCGVYGASFKSIDIVLMVVFGLVGYLLRKFHFDLPMLVMGVVLGDRIEMAFRRAMSISQGDLLIFFKSSFSKVFIIAALVIIILQLTAWLLGFRVRQAEDKS
jgi:putative tricarboxylic transport membrane protein